MNISDEKLQKIMVIGLDQAGKTSILNVLNRKYNLMDRIKPTVGIERGKIEILGMPIISWDLGGQEKYREKYLKNPTYFTETDSVFFIIDGLDYKRYEEAIVYFNNVLKIFDKLMITPEIVVCLHKIDPNIRDEPKTIEMVEKLKKFIISRSGGRQMSFFITSIYDRKTIVEAFAKTIQAIVVEVKPFNKLLKDLSTFLKLDAAILFDDNMLPLSEYYKSTDIEHTLLDTMFNAIDHIKHSGSYASEHFAENFEMMLEFKSEKKYFRFLEVQFKGWNLYLLTMSDEIQRTDTILNKYKAITQLFDKELQ